MGKAKTEQRRVFYFQHLLANGEIRDVEVFSGLIKVHGRELLYSIIHDISKRKRAEKSVRNSEEKYHRLFKLMRLMADNMPDLIWAKDMDGRYMFVNQAMCDKLIMCDCPDRAIGMTNMVIAEKERNAGYEHTFGEICVNSDAIVQERKVACRILEEGFVRNEYLVLDVHKAPFLDENREIIGTVGCGRDVTNEKVVEKALKEREIELKRKNLRLEELNSALKILLEKRDEDKKVLEEKVLMNIKNLIIPYIVKLKKTPLNDRQDVFVEIIQSNIDDILSPFAHKLSYKYLNFTPTELQVADLVKQGLRTKEIADLLNSSPETVSGHRKSMRKKLNLKDKKSNLRTHLLSIDNGYN
jgi:DNA-binding CsgD family transcriptional regulator